jgi:hypothetical protein
MFKLQEDPELAAVHRQAFDESVRMAHADIMRAPVNSPMILSGGQPLPSTVGRGLIGLPSGGRPLRWW